MCRGGETIAGGLWGDKMAAAQAPKGEGKDNDSGDRYHRGAVQQRWTALDAGAAAGGGVIKEGGQQEMVELAKATNGETVIQRGGTRTTR